MLHSGEVSDSDLAFALVEEYYGSLHRFAFWLTQDGQIAGEAALKVAGQAVEERHRFWNQTSLPAWLLGLVYKDLVPDRRWWGFGGRSRRWRAAESSNLRRVSLRLRLEGGLSPKEIGFILGVSERAASNRLELAYREVYTAVETPDHLPENHGWLRRLLYTQRASGLDNEEERDRLERGLENCDSCRRYAWLLQEEETRWSERLPQVPDIVGRGLEKAHSRLQAFINKKNGRARGKTPVREMLLVGGLLAVLVFFGVSLDLFESFDARPSPTPIPTAGPPPDPPPPLILEGEEGASYFYYTYDRDRETVEQIADFAGISVEAVEYINLGINYGSRSSIRLVAFRSDDRFQPSGAPPPIPTSAPLTASSPLAEVIARGAEGGGFGPNYMLSSIYIEYGKPGYSGTPAVYLSLVGSAGPEHWVLIRESYREKNTLSVIRAGDILFSKSDQREWFGTEVTEWHSDLRETFASGVELPQDGSARVADEGIVAGRPAVLVEWADGDGLERFWVDAATGHVLRYEVYGGSGGDTPLALYLITSLHLGEDLPDWLFYPGAYRGETLETLLFGERLDELLAALLRRGRSGS